MKIRIVIAIIAVTLIGGCTPQWKKDQEVIAARMQQANAEAAAAIKECNGKLQSGELKTNVEAANCKNPRAYAAFEKAGYPYMDLINLVNAKLLELAERLDKKEITEAQKELEFAEFSTRIENEVHRRDAEQQQSQSQRAMAAMAMFSSMPRYQAPQTTLAPLPAPALRPSVNTSCMATGQYLNCTSN